MIFDPWRRKNILQGVTVTPDMDWKVIGKTNPVTLEEIPTMVNEMRDSFFTHKTLDVNKRIEQLQQLLKLFNENESDILGAMYTDLHRNEFEGNMYDISMVTKDIKEMIKHLPKWSTPRCYGRSLMSLFSSGYIVPEPFGVALVIGTWNYPFMLSMMPLAAAIGAGNVVVVKPSNVSPTCSKLISRLLRQYMDPTVVQVVGSEMKGDRGTTGVLLDQKFDFIFFTGNHDVGRIVMEKAAKHLTPVVLELGGKNPVIITKNADLYLAAKRVLTYRAYNGGQQCVSPDYVMIEKEVEDAFYTAVKKVENECFANAKEEIGRIVDLRHYDSIVKLYQDSLSSIGDVVIGGIDHFDRDSLYIPPTVLRMLNSTAPLMTEELFSPILPVFAVDSYQDAIKMCNEREKPLSLYVFSEKRKEVEDVVFSTSAGGVTVNSCLMHISHPDLPFGGVGQSGMGCYHGIKSFETFSHLFYIVKYIIDRKPVAYKTKWPYLRFIYDFPVTYFPFAKWKLNIVKMLLKLCVF